MKIITYSDLHLEFGTNIKPPANSDADVMILAGDIITFKDYNPLSRFLEWWQKPVLYIAGNHEYYTHRPIAEENKNFKLWLADNHKNVTFLQDEEISIDGVNFFCHTHECDNQMLGKTRVISNQLGYPGHFGSYECKDFDVDGLPIVL